MFCSFRPRRSSSLPDKSQLFSIAVNTLHACAFWEHDLRVVVSLPYEEIYVQKNMIATVVAAALLGFASLTAGAADDVKAKAEVKADTKAAKAEVKADAKTATADE